MYCNKETSPPPFRTRFFCFLFILKKLLCSQVKIGSEVKQIVSGIKKYYSPEDMLGKKVMVLVNLKPAKLAGVLSEGMLLCAEDADGNLALMTPDKNMPAGAEIC